MQLLLLLFSIFGSIEVPRLYQGQLGLVPIMLDAFLRNYSIDKSAFGAMIYLEWLSLTQIVGRSTFYEKKALLAGG